jgi:hypothetical protein
MVVGFSLKDGVKLDEILALVTRGFLERGNLPC